MPLDRDDIKRAEQAAEARRNIERQIREMQARWLRDETTG